MMMSIYERALGDTFRQLHPLLQRKFSLHSGSRFKAVGEGTMSFIQGGKGWMKPLFILGARRHLFFPERGVDVPFRIENVAYADPLGRESVAWIRRFYFPGKTRAFDATMIYSEKRQEVLDYLGNKQRLISPLHFQVTDTGGLEITSKETYFWCINRRIIAPSSAGPTAVIKEEVADEANGIVSIHVKVDHPLFGSLIEYKGKFRLAFSPVSPGEMKEFYPSSYEERE